MTATCMISIHAPARGATTLERLQVQPENFNPRSREGSDQAINADTVANMQFQSTLPRGERLHLLTFFRLQYGYILFHLTNKYSFCF